MLSERHSFLSPSNIPLCRRTAPVIHHLMDIWVVSTLRNYYKSRCYEHLCTGFCVDMFSSLLDGMSFRS